MNNLNERLDEFRQPIQGRDFLEDKGLSSEVNIRIFCYNPRDEMTVIHFLGQIITDQSFDCNLVECNPYKPFIEICKDLDILDSIPDMEESEESEYLLEQLHSVIGGNEFTDKMYEKYQPKIDDIIPLTGVGDVFPFMGVHKILEAMQPSFSEIPILVVYPSVLDGDYLRLFGKLQPNPYYRAFNVV